jgi:putative membrane protein
MIRNPANFETWETRMQHAKEAARILFRVVRAQTPKEDRMKHIDVLLAGAAVCALTVFNAPAPAQQYPDSANRDSSANRMSAADSTFASKAAQGGMAEVKLGHLAKEKASSRAVKEFGQKMIDDHTKANDELQSIAAKKGITLPATIDSKDQATYDRLSKLSGAEFDRAYMRDMVSDHRTDVSEFRRESEHGADPDLKAFAAKTLPTLEEHLKMAEQTEGQVKAEK